MMLATIGCQFACMTLTQLASQMSGRSISKSPITLHGMRVCVCVFVRIHALIHLPDERHTHTHTDTTMHGVGYQGARATMVPRAK